MDQNVIRGTGKKLADLRNAGPVRSYMHPAGGVR
jgi:hypothetical protein